MATHTNTEGVRPNQSEENKKFKKRLTNTTAGRQKYDSETLKALPFKGLSVIHDIEEVQAKGLRQKAKAFKTSLQNGGIQKKIAWVSFDSFHITTFNLVCDEDMWKHSWSCEQYKKIQRQIEVEVLNFMRNEHLLEVNATIKRIWLFPSGVVYLRLELTEKDKQKFQEFRKRLNRHLKKEVPDYFRDPDWKGRFAPHITLGYVVNPLDQEEINTFVKILREFNEFFTPINFKLTKGKVMQFADIDSYSVVRDPRTEALCRISTIVDKELKDSEVFRRKIDKTEFMEVWSTQMDKKVRPEELLSISEEKLTQRIGQMMAWRGLFRLLDDLTPEQMEIFDAAVEGR